MLNQSLEGLLSGDKTEKAELAAIDEALASGRIFATIVSYYRKNRHLFKCLGKWQPTGSRLKDGWEARALTSRSLLLQWSSSR